MESLHNGKPFTTYDQDNDEKSGGNCANTNGGGWWFVKCDRSNLNGYYGQDKGNAGLTWYTWRNTWDYSYKASQIKIRPVNHNKRK